MKISKDFSEKDFKIGSHNRNGAFIAIFIFSLSETNSAIKEWSDKQDIIHLGSI